MKDDVTAKYLLLGEEVFECDIIAEGIISALETIANPVNVSYRGMTYNSTLGQMSSEIHFIADYINPKNLDILNDKFLIVRVK